jgi:hypothetical protein
MRCPHCGGLNPDSVRYCALCGRDVTAKPTPARPSNTSAPVYPGTPRPQQQPVQRPVMPQQQQSSTVNRQPQPVQRPGQPYQPNPQQQGQRPPMQPTPMTGAAATAAKAVPPTRQRVNTQPAPLVSPTTEPAGPEPPVPFPPRSITELKALEQGALPYTGIDEAVKNGGRKVVRITFQRCTAWQQVATLLKALKEYDTPTCDTIIIQGVQTNSTDIYNFTNGQLLFDRNVRLGSQLQNRYQIETGNGFSSGSIRIVISE